MKSNELRVGNHLFKYGEVVKIVEIGIKHKGDTNYYLRSENDNCGYWIDQFNPIPLTEEILLKCCFEKTIVNTMIKAWLNFSFYLTIRDDGELFYEWKGGNIQVKYLHQLQNLYFALTNKELEINL